VTRPSALERGGSTPLWIPPYRAFDERAPNVPHGLRRGWMPPIDIRHGHWSGPKTGAPIICLFPVAPAELDSTNSWLTRTCRSGLHSAAAFAAGSCSGSRSSNAACDGGVSVARSCRGRTRCRRPRNTLILPWSNSRPEAARYAGR